MGIVRMGPPAELVLLLKNEYGLETFVETGTFHGDTAAWASAHFGKVVSIEALESLYDQAVERYRAIPNLQILLGDSREILPAVVRELGGPALFWLDAHWSGTQTAGEREQCPLVREIEVITQSPISHFILADDARLFLSPPPLPNEIGQWPPIYEVMRTLHAKGNHPYIVIHDDVIVAVPPKAESTVARYCQAINTRAWQEHSARLRRARCPKIVRGVELIGKGIAMIGEDILTRILRFIPRMRDVSY